MYGTSHKHIYQLQSDFSLKSASSSTAIDRTYIMTVEHSKENTVQDIMNKYLLSDGSQQVLDISLKTQCVTNG